MRAKLDDWEQGAQIFLELETLKELNDAVRFAQNAKIEPPTIRVEFSEDGKPYLYVYFKKREPINQKNYISNR